MKCRWSSLLFVFSALAATGAGCAESTTPSGAPVEPEAVVDNDGTTPPLDSDEDGDDEEDGGKSKADAAKKPTSDAAAADAANQADTDATPVVPPPGDIPMPASGITMIMNGFTYDDPAAKWVPDGALGNPGQQTGKSYVLSYAPAGGRLFLRITSGSQFATVGTYPCNHKLPNGTSTVDFYAGPGKFDNHQGFYDDCTVRVTARTEATGGQPGRIVGTIEGPLKKGQPAVPVGAFNLPF